MINTKTIANERENDPLSNLGVEADFFEAVQFERTRQNRKFPNQTKQKSLTLDRLYAILGEEVGEVAKAILEYDDVGTATELVEVAAVCLKMVELKFPHLMKDVKEKVFNRMWEQKAKD